MNIMIIILAGFVMTAFVMGLNVYWYRVKSFLRGHGYEVHNMSHHFKDFSSLRDLSKNGSSKDIREVANKHYTRLIVGFIVFILAVIPILIFSGDFILPVVNGLR
jgi:uncharacterized integral membrane protein